MRALFVLLAAVVSWTAGASVAEFDERIAKDLTMAGTNGLAWVDGRNLPLESKGFAETYGGPYGRLPADMEKRFDRGNLSMSKNSTGHYFRFKTDSDVVGVEWIIWGKEWKDPYIPPQGMYGVDIYEKLPEGWRFLKNGRLSPENEKINITSVRLRGAPGLKGVLVYLPTRGTIKEIRIGLKPGSKLLPYPHESGIVKPVVHYGTSIVHGGCSSRPGLCFANRTARLVDAPYVNLGFSGGGKLQPEFIDALARIDASLYIVDCVWNCVGDMMTERLEGFLRGLHAKRPDTPILVCEGVEPNFRRHGVNRQQKEVFDRLKSEGSSLSAKLHYLPAEGLLPRDGEGTHDSCHPNDYGAVQVSEVFATKISSILGVAGTAAAEEMVDHPVSQNLRGHENVEWSTADAYHLTDENRNLPRVLLVGDSICCNYQRGVRTALEGKMNVSFWASSYCVTSPSYLKFLSIYLDEAKYDVIHFNNGLHSLSTPDEDWRKGFRAALKLIRAKQPLAKLVWTTSTPLKDPKKTAKAKALNAIAAEEIAALGNVAVDDLFALMDPLDREANWSDTYHFKKDAVELQVRHVAASCLGNR